MREFKGPRKQLGFIFGATAGPIAGKLLSGLGGLMGGGAEMQALNAARDDIKELPGMTGPVNVSGNFGSTVGGNFQMDPGLQGLQAMQTAGGGLMGGGMFNDPNFQQAFQQNDMAGALGQSNQALMQQMGPSAFGGLGGMFQQAQGLGNQFSNMTAQGPQDFSGGMQGAQFGMGMQNQLSAMDQSGLQSQELQTMRTAAQPAMDRQFNKLQDKLFAMGMGGSTGGGQQLEGLFNSFGQQDLGFQQEAFNRASQQQNFLGNMGAQQMGMGSQLMGQNLGQFNQGAQLANMFQQGAAGMEGQQFGQNLQSTQQNQSAGMNRLNQAMGLFGQGADVFGQQFGLGLQSAAGALDFGRFGMDAAALPSQLQAGLLQGGGEHARALGGLGAQRGSATSGFLGGIGKSLGSIFSDKRLKDNITRIGSLGDLSWYKWDWNEKAKELGANKHPPYGVIAQEVAAMYPQAVSTESGYLKVNYNMILGV